MTMPKLTPEPTLRRLPQYLRLLRTGAGTHANCTELAETLFLDPTQVRKDIEVTGIVGRPRIGYDRAALIAAIESFLGWDKTNEAFLAGAGSLGSALLGYRLFREHGLEIVAAFDDSAAKIGTRIHDKEVLDIARLPRLAKRMHVRIGIITAPAEAAQAIADRMVAGGMLAIWNFAPLRLRVPEDVLVHQEDLYCSLASLSRKLAERMAGERSAR